MPNQTHTPGPWFVEKATDGTLWVTLGSTPRYIAKCGLATVDGNPANARLIAHAPAMVAALRAYIDLHASDATEHGYATCDCDPCIQARAILRAVDQTGD
jgi:hypothetical protein